MKTICQRILTIVLALSMAFTPAFTAIAEESPSDVSATVIIEETDENVEESETEISTEITTVAETEAETEVETEAELEAEAVAEDITDSLAFAAAEVENESETNEAEPEVRGPEITSIDNIDGGVLIIWVQVEAAPLYRVFRKVSEGDWEWLLDVETTYCRDNTVESGETYSYTIQCINEDGSPFSTFDDTGKSITYISVPEINSINIENDGVKVTWNKVTGAEAYRLLRRTDSTEWESIEDTAALAYTDYTAASGETYFYTVQCLDSGGNPVSEYKAEGTPIFYASNPVVSGASNVAGGVKISWGKTTGAAQYAVYRKTGTEDWTKITDTTATTYTDSTAVSGTKYSYTVKCLDDAGQSNSGYDTVGKSITYVAAPVLGSVSNVYGGVTVTWGKVTGAAKYRVYRKTETGSWAKLVDTTTVSYTDKTAVSGTKYYYTVRCMDSAGTLVSAYDTAGKAVTYVAAPAISSVSNVVGGVKITWSKVAGAAKYRIYRKKGTGSWTNLGDATTVTFTDKTAVSGTKYAYTVRCLNSSGQVLSSYNPSGKTITYVAAPTLGKVSNGVGGVTITWSKVTGAAKYRVFRKTGSGSWTKLVDTTAATYTDKKAVSGTKYYYTVRCLNSAGSMVSAYNTSGLAITYVAAPVISSVSNAVGGVKISWGKVTGAAKYRVFRKTGSGSWTKVADTTAVTYIDKKAASGTKYYYTVRCMNSAGSYVSAYNTTGKAITYVAAPVISSLSNSTSGVKIYWGKVNGAAKYRVFRKTGSGSWTKLADTTAVSYVDKTGKNGTKYYYTVRCLNSSGAYVGAYDTVGKSITYKKLTMDVNKKTVSMSFAADYSVVTVTYLGNGYVNFEIEDDDIIDKCEWGNWSGYNLPLRIYPGRKEGTTYITLTNSTSGETIRIKVTITSPLTISLPSVPKTIINYRYDGSYEQMGSVTGISYTCEKRYSEGYIITVNLEGNKTYDYKGAFQSRTFKVGYKLYDSGDYVVDSGTRYTESIAEGEMFRHQFTIYLDSDDEDYYRLELLNIN